MYVRRKTFDVNEYSVTESNNSRMHSLALCGNVIIVSVSHRLIHYASDFSGAFYLVTWVSIISLTSIWHYYGIWLIIIVNITNDTNV